ncbi:MAG: hypothetical protein ACYDIC_14145 [Desulfobaccales bacterium]
MPGFFWKRGRFRLLLLLSLAIMLELSGVAAGQQLSFPGGGKRPGGSEAAELRRYDPQTVTTVKGQVESLGSYGQTGWRVTPGMQTQGLVLKTGAGNITINLGPPWYVNKQGFPLKPGDSLEVTGSKITQDEQTWLLAAQIKKEGRTLTVRDENGAPLWQEQDRPRGGRDSGGKVHGGMGGGMGSGGRGLGGLGKINW